MVPGWLIVPAVLVLGAAAGLLTALLSGEPRRIAAGRAVAEATGLVLVAAGGPALIILGSLRLFGAL